MLPRSRRAAPSPGRPVAVAGAALGALVIVAAGCGGDDAGPGRDDAGVPPPPPGTSAPGWRSAYDPDGRAVACGAGEAAFAALPHVAVGSATLYAGYAQVSADNQDPVVARFDAGVETWCVRHETQPPDGRALAVTWDGGAVAYVVYTVVGGGTDLEGKGGWLPAYAPGAISGGGAKVSYVGQVDAATGALVTGTFVIAVKGDGSVNSHAPRGPVTVLADDGGVEFLGSSAHKAIDVDGQRAMACTDYPFESRYRFPRDLATVTCADCTNCTPQRPCP